MKALKARITKGLCTGSKVVACDNSGAKIVQIYAVKRAKTVKRRIPTAGIGDLVFASVKKGIPGMKKQKVLAVVVRQKKEYRRSD